MSKALPYYELLYSSRKKWGELKASLLSTWDMAGYKAADPVTHQMGNSVYMQEKLHTSQLFKLSKKTLDVVLNKPHIPESYEDFRNTLPFNSCYFEIPDDYSLLLAESSEGAVAHARAMMIIPFEGEGMLVGTWYNSDAVISDQQAQMGKKAGFNPTLVTEAISNIVYSEIISTDCEQEVTDTPYIIYPISVASYILHGDNYYIQKKKSHHTFQRNGHHKKKRYWYYYCHKDIQAPWEPPSGNGAPLQETQWVRGRVRKYFFCPICGKNQAIKDILEYRSCLRCGAEIGSQDKWEVQHRPLPTYARGPNREDLMKGLIEGKQKKHVVQHENPNRQDIIKRDKLLDSA